MSDEIRHRDAEPDGLTVVRPEGSRRVHWGRLVGLARVTAKHQRVIASAMADEPLIESLRALLGPCLLRFTPPWPDDFQCELLDTREPFECNASHVTGAVLSDRDQDHRWRPDPAHLMGQGSAGAGAPRSRRLDTLFPRRSGSFDPGSHPAAQTESTVAGLVLAEPIHRIRAILLGAPEILEQHRPWLLLPRAHATVLREFGGSWIVLDENLEPLSEADSEAAISGRDSGWVLACHRQDCSTLRQSLPAPPIDEPERLGSERHGPEKVADAGVPSGVSGLLKPVGRTWPHIGLQWPERARSGDWPALHQRPCLALQFPAPAKGLRRLHLRFLGEGRGWRLPPPAACSLDGQSANVHLQARERQVLMSISFGMLPAAAPTVHTLRIQWPLVGPFGGASGERHPTFLHSIALESWS